MTDENSKIDIELLKLKVDIWKTVINTQQHFNDLAMKIRNFAILILSAFIGAIGVSFKSGYSLPLFGHTSVATILCLGAAGIWLLFFFVDIYWYHPLLVGAVNKGLDIEKNIGDELKNLINLTGTIGKESPKEIKFSFFKKEIFKRKLHSKHKAKLFYLGVFFMLIIAAVALFFADTPDSKDLQLKQNSKTTISCNRNINYDGITCSFN